MAKWRKSCTYYEFESRRQLSDKDFCPEKWDSRDLGNPQLI